MIFWKRQSYGEVKRSGIGGGTDDWSEHRGYLGPWKYSVRCCYGGHMSLYICHSVTLQCSPPGVTPQHWTQSPHRHLRHPLHHLSIILLVLPWCILSTHHPAQKSWDDGFRTTEYLCCPGHLQSYSTVMLIKPRPAQKHITECRHRALHRIDAQTGCPITARKHSNHTSLIQGNHNTSIILVTNTLYYQSPSFHQCGLKENS